MATTHDLEAERILLKEISKGNTIAFNKMFTLYKGKIYAFVDSYIHNKADAEEVVQDVFLTIWKNRDKLLHIDHPRNYIYTMARNRTYDYLAKISKNREAINNAWINTSVSLNNTEDLMNVKETEHLINWALKSLSAQKQEIFTMSRVQYMSHEEIAGVVGLSKSRVKNVIVEVLKHLKYHIAKQKIISSITLLFAFFA